MGRGGADAVPFVDARLPDESRAHAVLGCLASPGTCISLRVPAQPTFSLQDCVAPGSLAPGAAQLLTRMIEARLAFLISGGTGSGKPTLGLPHTDWGGLLGVAPSQRGPRRNGGSAVARKMAGSAVSPCDVSGVPTLRRRVLPPIEAMVAVVIAGGIGWFVFRAFFAAGDRLQRVRIDPTQSAGRRRGAFWLSLCNVRPVRRCRELSCHQS